MWQCLKERNFIGRLLLDFPTSTILCYVAFASAIVYQLSYCDCDCVDNGDLSPIGEF